jgi:phosphate transport system protein
MLRYNFQNELTELHTRLLFMGGRIEEMLNLSLHALRTGDLAASDEVLRIEDEIDKLAEEVDARSVELIAKQQPVGQDLRRLIGSMRMAIDMERVADINVNIVEQANLLPRPLIKPLVDIPRMIDVSASMFQDALDALINSNCELAYLVLQRDDVVDKLCEDIIVELREIMIKDSNKVSGALPLFVAAIQIERIADHATNIAESVIYICNGKRVKA